MSMAAKTAFVNAFAAIPQRVIWKFEEPIEDITDNVLLSSWIPQRDILGRNYRVDIPIDKILVLINYLLK